MDHSGQGEANEPPHQAGHENIDPQLLSQDQALGNPGPVHITFGPYANAFNHHHVTSSPANAAQHPLAPGQVFNVTSNQFYPGQLTQLSYGQQVSNMSPQAGAFTAAQGGQGQDVADQPYAGGPYPNHPSHPSGYLATTPSYGPYPSYGGPSRPESASQPSLGFGLVGMPSMYPQFGQQTMMPPADGLSMAMSPSFAGTNHGIVSDAPPDDMDKGVDAEPPSKKRKVSQRAAGSEATGALRAKPKLKTLAEIPQNYRGLVNTAAPLKQYTKEQSQRLNNPIVPLNIAGGNDQDDFAMVLAAKDSWIRRIMFTFTADFLDEDPYGKVSAHKWTDFQVTAVIQVTKLLESRPEQAELSATNLFYAVLEIHDKAKNPNCGPRSIGVAPVDNTSKCSVRMSEVIRSLTSVAIMRKDVLTGHCLHEYASNPVHFRISKMKNKKGNDDKNAEKARRDSLARMSADPDTSSDPAVGGVDAGGAMALGSQDMAGET